MTHIGWLKDLHLTCLTISVFKKSTNSCVSSFNRARDSTKLPCIPAAMPSAKKHCMQTCLYVVLPNGARLANTHLPLVLVEGTINHLCPFRSKQVYCCLVWKIVTPSEQQTHFDSRLWNLYLHSNSFPEDWSKSLWHSCPRRAQVFPENPLEWHIPLHCKTWFVASNTVLLVLRTTITTPSAGRRVLIHFSCLNSVRHCLSPRAFLRGSNSLSEPKQTSGI